jgi:hypothetical protein
MFITFDHLERAKSGIIQKGFCVNDALNKPAIASRWCNWELGLGDAKENPRHIALMSISNSSTSWAGSEFLQLYPYITTKSDYYFDSYGVEFQGKKVSLKDWLND